MLLLLPAAAGVGAAGPVEVPGGEHGVAYFPDLQAGEKDAHATFSARPLGQQGFGETVIEIQNRTDRTTAFELRMAPRSVTSPALLARTLGPRGALRVETVDEQGVKAGFYTGLLSGDEPLGGIARIGWSTGARAAYEAVPPATDLILPLVARSVYGHYSVLTILNTDTSAERNEVDLRIYDNQSGELVKMVTAAIPAGESTVYDTVWDERLFGSDVVGSNAPTGGWLGHVWITAQKPVVVLAYGDEENGDGSMAYVGRPVSSANAVQYLPLVRANYHGSSLIAVANASNEKVDVSVEYTGASYSPSGAGETFQQSFSITPRGSRFVDISDRGRSTVPRPVLPAGRSVNTGFVGSAVIRASGPVLAVVQDEEETKGKVNALAAYNAVGPDELGTAFGVPGWRDVADHLSTTLLLQNPGEGEVVAQVQILTEDDQLVADLERRVPAGGVGGVSVLRVPGAKAGEHYRALIEADGPIAALVVEEPGQSANLVSPDAAPREPQQELGGHHDRRAGTAGGHRRRW